MAVSISRDLSVQVLDDPNKVKLTERQQQLHAAIQKGEPKCLGVSIQVMLGLMVITYSLPLHFTVHTPVVIFGVPWWTGLTFIAAGLIAVTLDKHFSMKIVSLRQAYKNLNVFSVLYFLQQKFSKGLKSSLLFFTLAQAVISAVFCWLLYRQRNIFAQYAVSSFILVIICICIFCLSANI
uniref:Uncharacterized protein n=1 Tax=Xiphophorus couchianus TaxID=32473 RepID=A0A3B5LV28_9TELE